MVYWAEEGQMSDSGPKRHPNDEGTDQFETTHWSVVLARKNHSRY